MKTHLPLIVLLVLLTTSCAIKKKNCPVNEGLSNFQIVCTESGVPSSSFSGKIVDLKTNETVINARVVIKSKKGSEYYGANTDLDGYFAMKDIAPGTYHLEVTDINYADLRAEIEIKKHSDCVADIKLDEKPIMVLKPVIYLYPTHTQTVHVELNYAGALTHTYPKYPATGWDVTAEPDGTLRDRNNQEYYALFWEGKPTKQIVPHDGFVVSGKDTEVFLEEKLAYLGLNRREANEFIMFWLPRMEDNAYNFIHFAGQQYEAQAELTILPKPETTIRVMMLTQPLENEITIPLQDLSLLKKTRKGYTVIEWGGSEVRGVVGGI